MSLRGRVGGRTRRVRGGIQRSESLSSVGISSRVRGRLFGGVRSCRCSGERGGIVHGGGGDGLMVKTLTTILVLIYKDIVADIKDGSC